MKCATTASVALACGLAPTDGATDLLRPHDLDQTGWANLVDTVVGSGGTADEIAGDVPLPPGEGLDGRRNGHTPA